VDVLPVNIREAGELEPAIAAFARSPNGGMILTGNGLSILHRDLIIALVARHKLQQSTMSVSMSPPAA